MSDCCAIEAKNRRERQLLWTVLVLNAVMFFVEFTAGWLARSSGLLADSLDMLADAMVYAISLYAVGKAIKQKAKAAMANGILQFSLGILILLDVGKRIYFDEYPTTEIMTWISLLALTVNIICFTMLYQHRQGDINLRASWICSRNDMIANVGVLLAAVLVVNLNSAWPDRLIGLFIAAIIVRSAIRIISDAKYAIKHNKEFSSDSCCG
ncbi:cation diffusion facilitator family transporter [Gayadomonas joobiniege]|uniref:cation diffusion facilitator family transporter n=1 Tax=Gayadomonas joobiniege TaxID=1234606 RepID=UPI0003757FC2|nr:cation diffusion facilitator family transporter [Gayadomonas joobiniege]